MPPPAARMRLATPATSTMVLHSSQASTSMSTSGPSTRFSAHSTISPWTLAKLFDGSVDRHHWMT
jgi:hypothetical protein